MAVRGEAYRSLPRRCRLGACAGLRNCQQQNLLHIRSNKNDLFAQASRLSISEFFRICILQSNVHEIWGRFFSSTMKDDINYSPSDCFETFPFPESWKTHSATEVAGRTYFEFRAALMVRNDEGMTKTYNRFHDPYEDGPEIDKLRELHAAMDRAVLDAYGWTDIATDCDFFLDYEIDEATWGRKRKPYRYRWPNPVRDEVLARLLALNAERAAEEARTGTTSHPTPGKSTADPTPSRYPQAPAYRPKLKVAEPKPLWPPSDD